MILGAVRRLKKYGVLLGLVGITTGAFAAPSPKSSLKSYEPISGISGNLTTVGSDTLNNLMTLWAESFRAYYPNVNIQVEGKGSSTVPPALIEGTAQFGPMSRAMKSGEIDAFEKEYGYKPTKIGVAIDALAIFVHKDNPIDGLTMRQVDSIFSNTFKTGGSPIRTWGDVGLKGDWYDRSVSLYGRNSASGTYGYFKQVALRKGDYRESVKEQPGSSAVVQGISADVYGLGYSGIGYHTSGVKPLRLGVSELSMFEPTFENCISGDYPLARLLYIYINKKPNQSVDMLTREFLKFILSKEGQTVVVKDGYFPLPPEIVDDMISIVEE